MMGEENLTSTDKFLLHLHNMGAVSVDRAVGYDATPENKAVLAMLVNCVSTGYVRLCRRGYYLTGRGILKVCSCFT